MTTNSATPGLPGASTPSPLPSGPVFPDVPDAAAYLRACTQIEPMAYEEECVRVPGDLAFWGERYAWAHQAHQEAKVAREVGYARLYDYYSDSIAKSRPGRVTAAEVEAAVAQDAAYVALRAAEVVADANRVRIHGFLEAIKAKREMLISIGAHQRAEWAGDPSVRLREQIERERQGAPR